jgi:DNA repair protein RadA/Sms
LGGGLLAGSVALLGGDPGIGKSTLLLQVAAHVGQSRPVLYASGEESVAQVALRAQRLGLVAQHLTLVNESDLEQVLELSVERKVALLVVDSIQTVQLGDTAALAGAVTQLRECTARLVRFAKSSGTAVVIIGHVTKEGAIAGPRLLEHLVDTVLYFESDAGSRYRLIRTTKNRFGAAHELGFFAMSETGLKEVRNPAAIFLARSPEPSAGSIVTVTRDGGRPLLIELQGLVDRMRFGAPRCVAQGLDANRVAMLLAVLSRHAGVSLQEHDVFANVVGGIRIEETAWDLPLVLALASSLNDRPLPRSLIAFGELGLTGELRPVAYGEERLREAQKQGFKQLRSWRATTRRASRSPDLRCASPGASARRWPLPSARTRIHPPSIRRCEHSHGLDRVIRDLQHLELIASDLERGSRVGNGLQLLQQQPVHGLGAPPWATAIAERG